MCGIAGIVDRSANKQTMLSTVSRMIQVMEHRGPDAQDISAHEHGVFFGHTRLSIIDLSMQAIQPMESTSGQSKIVFNGEIYNYRALRTELKHYGFQFKTSSDTEVLLNAYEHWGIDCIERLNGIFAFAIHDYNTGDVWLARDRLGIKPLYVVQTDNRILFASELKGILATRLIKANIDPDALSEYLTFQNILSEKTLIKDISLFPPAHIACIQSSYPTITFTRYWQAHLRINPLPYDEKRQILQELIERAVVNQTHADVPVHAFLSGGIDSGALAAIAAQKNNKLMTFTCGFDINQATTAEQRFDERNQAQEMAQYIGSIHHEIFLNESNFLQLLHQWAWHAEEPRVGSTVPNFMVSNLAAQFGKVCLSGIGGDELFGGYPWRYMISDQATTKRDFQQKYYQYWNRVLSPQRQLHVFNPLLQQTSLQMEDHFLHYLEDCASRVDPDSQYPWADTAILFDIEHFLHSLLIAEDKASMAHGLEVRVPLLDNDLIDFALSIPFEEKVCMQTYTQQPSHFYNGKVILRDVFSQYVPQKISQSSKQGFSPPFESWFRHGLSTWLMEEIFTQQSVLNDFIDMRAAREIFQEHLNGMYNHRLFIWSMISLSLFHQKFIASPL